MPAEPTALTTEDYAEIGAAFVGAVLTSSGLGHVSCAGLADYVSRSELTDVQALVLDAFTATRGDARSGPAQKLMAEWVTRHQFERRVLAEAVAGGLD